jgi:hypothetical protein
MQRRAVGNIVEFIPYTFYFSGLRRRKKRSVVSARSSSSRPLRRRNQRIRRERDQMVTTPMKRASLTRRGTKIRPPPRNKNPNPSPRLRRMMTFYLLMY